MARGEDQIIIAPVVSRDNAALSMSIEWGRLDGGPIAVKLAGVEFFPVAVRAWGRK